MKAYDPDENTDKSKVGQVFDGFNFLGCSIQANSVIPSKKARKSFLRNIRYTLNTGSHAITAYASADNERRAEEAFAQVLVRVDRLIRGWGDAFPFTNNRLPFHQIDSEINRMLREFKGRANHCINSAVIDDRRRRALGVALLKDTPRLPIEELVDQVGEA